LEPLGTTQMLPLEPAVMLAGHRNAPHWKFLISLFSRPNHQVPEIMIGYLPAMNEVPIVLLHCYPFIREASWLAGLFSNVYLDLCMVLQWVVHRGPDLILEALDVAPVSKLLFATDGFRVPELFYLGATWWRDDLAHVLAEFIDRGFVDEARAVEWGRSVLRDNALRVYPFTEGQRT